MAIQTDELIATYEIGQTIRLRCLISDPDTGLPVDPTGVSVTVKSPTGVRTFPPALKEAAGQYSILVTPQQPGSWSFRFQGGNAVVAVNEGRFFVRKTMV